ncbi:MAG: hypothetical protein E6Q99_04730, partial [Elusimicrobia bacterium]
MTCSVFMVSVTFYTYPRSDDCSRGNRMRLAVVQTNPAPGAGDQNRARARAWMERVPADVYVLPELAFSGYNFANRRQARARAETRNGPSVRWAEDFCRATGSHVLFGFPEAAGGAVHNAAALVGP